VEQKIGHYSFIGGVIIAVVLGLFSSKLGPDTAGLLTSLMIVLGLIVGFLNISGKETKEFMMVSLVLIIAAFAGDASSVLGGVDLIGPFLSGIFGNLLALVIPAAIIVALKELWSLGQNPE